MRFERFIAQRFMPLSGEGGGFSGPLSRIAVAGVAMGVVVMLVSVSVLRGFQGEIATKVAGFGGHIAAKSFATVTPYDEAPIEADSTEMARLETLAGVRHVQRLATKGGMVKTGEQIHGVILRGMGSEADTTFMHSCLTEGRMPQTALPSPTSEVIISSTIASKLGLTQGDKMRTYFWHDGSSRARVFEVCGIYKTDLSEMDETMVVGDLRQVQRLNGWEANQVGGYEILVENLEEVDDVAQRVMELLPYDLKVETLIQSHPALFAWLDLLNSNITLILAIMCIVSAIAVVSALLIMIFEKRRTIGVLKTLGATDRSVRKIFMLKAMRLTLLGILIGDAVGLGLCLIQHRWQPLRLDAESYSMTHVPIDLDPMIAIGVSVGTLAVCLVALLLPVGYISRISPAMTVRNG